MLTAFAIIRPVASYTELKAHFTWSNITFAHNAEPERIARWQDEVTQEPTFRQEQVRGAFLDNELVGGYIIHERIMRIGQAQIRAGCIAAVFTRPNYRQQGIAAALMQDAIHYAHAHHYGLLLLNGIAKFYNRIGYSDIFDVTNQEIEHRAVMTLPSSPYTIRYALEEDAEYVLSLYERHYGHYCGSFLRTIEQQVHQIHHLHPPNKPLWLAIDQENTPRGYLKLGNRNEPLRAYEIAVDTFQAGTTLLQHHARLMEESPEPLAYLSYSLPSDSPFLLQLLDRLEVTSTVGWEDPAYGWVVRDQTYHHRYAGWMGRSVSLPTIIHAMLPEWQTRWQHSLAHWSGDISLFIDKFSWTLSITGNTLQLLEQATSNTNTIHLNTQDLTQLLFGYRSISWICHEQQLPQEVLTALDILFPVGKTWLPRSDWF